MSSKLASKLEHKQGGDDPHNGEKKMTQQHNNYEQECYLDELYDQDFILDDFESFALPSWEVGNTSYYLRRVGHDQWFPCKKVCVGSGSFTLSDSSRFMSREEGIAEVEKWIGDDS